MGTLNLSAWPWASCLSLPHQLHPNEPHTIADLPPCGWQAILEEEARFYAGQVTPIPNACTVETRHPRAAARIVNSTRFLPKTAPTRTAGSNINASLEMVYPALLRLISSALACLTLPLSRLGFSRDPALLLRISYT